MLKKYFIVAFSLLSALSLFGQRHSTPDYFDEIWPFYNGYTMVSQNEKMGLINAKCELVVPCIYDEIGSFDLSPYFFYGTLAVRIGKKWGAIDSTGKMVLPIEYDYVDPFWNNGTSIVTKNGKKGVVNTKGVFTAPI